MRRLLLSVFVVCIFSIFLPGDVLADFNEAYQGYLYNFDIYRTKYSEFQIAKNEYLKYKTLTSQATALEKTKAMLAQRDSLLRSYLLVLYEKIRDENAGLTVSTRSQYQGILTSEISFLETHASQISALGSLEDAQDLSRELESHYVVLQTSIRQILIGLSLGQLAISAKFYDTLVSQIQMIVLTHQSQMTLEQQETINRWILQVGNKRNFYQQKVDSITQTSALIKTRDLRELESKYNQMVREAREARQYLLEGVSFITEIRNALKYAN